MARGKSSGGGIVIIGLIVLTMAVKYWYLLVSLGSVALVLYGIVRLVKSRSKDEMTKKYLYQRDIQANTVNIRKIHTESSPNTIVLRNEIATTNAIDAPATQHAKCAFCNTTGLHRVLRHADRTVDMNCFACGKNFYIFTPEINTTNANYQPASSLTKSPSQPDYNDSTIFGASAYKEKAVSPDALWVPCGKTTQIAGYSIPGGMIYVGSGLKSMQGGRAEPSLIKPKLKVDTTQPDREGRNMGYWPSYTDIDPTCRAAFLEWLSTDRKDPNTNIGYVFIFFYGLERRALADSRESISARSEISTIITEIKRLLAIYGENRSFQGYANKFLEALQISQTNEPLYSSSPQIESCSWEIPLTLKIALGQMAMDSVPLSAEWALAWAENDPSMPRRMPTQRCQAEFRELFKIRYCEKFGDGLKLKPNKARLSATYRPASSSFGGGVDIPISDLPDVTETTGAANKIRDIVNACTDELEGYSRYLGRNPDGKNSIEATSYLPQLLVKKHAGKDYQNLSSWLDAQVSSNTPVTLSFSLLLQHLSSINRDGFGKKEATAIGNILGKMNIGIEPDPRFGSFIPKPEQNVILFRISGNAPTSPSAEYSAATVVLHLASAVACADGTIEADEERHMEEHLETWLHLSSDESTRLRAHSQWLLTSFPGINGIKKRIELLKPPQKISLGKFLVGVAQADGYIDPAEMKILTKIYDMLGLDTQSLYSHAHAAAVEPVTVQAADFVNPQGYTIPKPQKTSQGISLDMSSIEAKLAETVAVSAILNNIFTEDEAITPLVAVSESSNIEVSIAGLDEETFLFMRILATKLTWAREELEQLASENNLMLDGTLDSINDAAYDHFGGPFFEGDDPIEIDPEYAKEIAA